MDTNVYYPACVPTMPFNRAGWGHRPRLPRVLVLVHCFYGPMWHELQGYLENLNGIRHDLFVSVPEDRVDSHLVARTVLHQCPGARVMVVENRGQDIGAAVHVAESVDLDAYNLVLKIHTKKATHLGTEGETWRHKLLSAVAGTRQRVDEVIDLFMRDQRVGMAGCREWVSQDLANPRNIDNMNVLSKRLGLPFWGPDNRFIAGTIFWTRPDVFKRIREAGIRQQDFHHGYQLDLTMAHALERIFGSLAQEGGRQIVGL